MDSLQGTTLPLGYSDVLKIRHRRAILERLNMTFTANGKNETFAVTFAVCLQLTVQQNQSFCICSE